MAYRHLFPKEQKQTTLTQQCDGEIINNKNVAKSHHERNMALLRNKSTLTQLWSCPPSPKEDIHEIDDNDGLKSIKNFEILTQLSDNNSNSIDNDSDDDITLNCEIEVTKDTDLNDDDHDDNHDDTSNSRLYEFIGNDNIDIEDITLEINDDEEQGEALSVDSTDIMHNEFLLRELGLDTKKDEHKIQIEWCLFVIRKYDKYLNTY